MHKVYLKPGKEESLKRFHPWIFSGAISRFDGEPEEGEVVEVYTSKKEFIAEGHFQIGSIAVRVLSFRQEPINHDFWKRKLEIAYDMRCAIGIAINPVNDTYRLVHGEGDNLPGLVIDIYAKTAVMQAHSAGMHVDRMVIAEALSEVMGDKIENIYWAMKKAIETNFPQAKFIAHFSHWYEWGCMVYDRFIIDNPPQDPHEALRLHNAVWSCGVRTALANGGVVNDHHGVGIKLGRLMKEQYGSAMQVFEGLKKQLDPNGIMNPYKLGL